MATTARRRSDALVLFGATGDLAAKKLFPAVYEMERDGRGSASPSSAWRRRSGRRAAARARPRRRRSRRGRRRRRRRVLDDLVPRHHLRPAATTARRALRALADAARSGIERPLFYLAIPPALFDDVIEGLAAVGLTERGPGGGREAVRPRPGVGAASSTTCCTGPSPRRRSSASTTSSARSRSRTCWCSASPTRCSSRCGTATTSRSVQITMAEEFGVEGRGQVLRDGRRPARRGAEPPPPGRRPAGHGAAGRRPTPTRCATRRSGCGARCARSTRPTIVRGQYRGYLDEDGRRAGLATSRPTSPCGSRSTRGAGRACPWLIRAGKSLPATATEAVVRVQRAAPPAVRRGRRRRPRPQRAAVPARPQRRRDPAPPGQGAGRRARHAAGRPRGVATTRRSAHRQEAYQRLLEDAMEGDHRRFGRADGVEEQWRIVDEVLTHGPPVQLYRLRHVGARRRRTPGRCRSGGWVEPLAED